MALETLGAAGSVLGIISFFMSNIPESAPTGTNVNIKAGRTLVGDPDPNAPNDLGGQIGAVYGYNSDNEFIGQSSNAFVGEADEVTFTVDQSSGGEQSAFVSIAARNDAICVSWVSVQNIDSSMTGGAWLGDVGRFCDQRWTFGREQAGTLVDSEEPYVPACTWFDKDFTDGTLSTAMKFRVSAYGSDARATFDEGRGCTATLFGREEAPIGGLPAKRDVPARPQWIVDELVISEIPGQTAEELCNSETSWGQDFVGVDGKFCDMGTKTLYTLCSTEDIDGCVEIAEPRMEVTQQLSVARRSIKSMLKSYTKVDHNRV